MKNKFCQAIALGCLLAGIVTAQAQYLGDGQTLIFDFNYQTNGAFVVGPQFSDDSLIIKGGAVLTSASGALGVAGQKNNANLNTGLITDSGSVWNAGNLDVGQSSAFNSLVIKNGGAVWGTGTVGGAYSLNGNSNSALITGAGSLWSNSAAVSPALAVGAQGSSNTLTIANGGVVVTSSAVVGLQAAAKSNSVWVTDPGSKLNCRTYLMIGNVGSFNSLVISNGGQVVGGGTVGQSGGNNAVLVTGQRSVWTNSGLTVGLQGGNNALTIANTGKVVTASITIGDVGPGNSLVISNGGILATTTGATLGSEGGSSNIAVVTGSAVWTNSANVTIGSSGSFNQLVISNDATGQGATVFDQTGKIGADSSASSNSAVVSGTNSVWSNASGLTVGSGGSFNSLVIRDGGQVLDYFGEVGAISGSNVVVVTGFGSVWSNADSLSLGIADSFNSLVISNGATVYNKSGSLGSFNGADGNSVLVTGQGSSWTNGASLQVGGGGSFNSLIISSGGRVFDSLGSLGHSSYSTNNIALVTGSSVWENTGALKVGDSGDQNSLIISNGGTVSADSVYIGFSKTTFNNKIIVTNGTLLVNGTLDVGLGTLAFYGGVVNVGSFLAANQFGFVSFHGGKLSSAATSIANGLPFYVGDGTLEAIYELKNGVHSFTTGLEISRNATLTGCGTVNGDLQVDPGGRVIVNCGTMGNITINGAVTNNGGMAALNGNVLTVKGPLVNNGVIVFNHSGTNFQGGIIKLGTIVDAGVTSIKGVSSQAGSFTVQIQSDQRLTYQLQYTDSLGSSNWTKIGTPQQGNGGSLSLVDLSAPSATGRFYQVVIGF